MTSTTTKQVIHGVPVVTTEVKTAAGVVRTYEGLVEAMAQPYRDLPTQEALRRISEKNREILRDNRELVEHFVT
jgi:hypothetical protein